MVDYDKIYHESLVEAGKVLKTVGGMGKPSQYKLAEIIFEDKLSRWREAEAAQYLAKILAKHLEENKATQTVVQPRQDFYVQPKHEEDLETKRRAQMALIAERERFEKLEKEFMEQFPANLPKT